VVNPVRCAGSRSWQLRFPGEASPAHRHWRFKEGGDGKSGRAEGGVPRWRNQRIGSDDSHHQSPGGAPDGKIRIKVTKTKKSRRMIVVSVFSIEAITGHLETIRATGPSDLVSCDTQGGRLRRPNTLRRHFCPIMKKAGLPDDIRPYDLRHSLATILLVEGESPKLVGGKARPQHDQADDGLLQPRHQGDAGAGRRQARLAISESKIRDRNRAEKTRAERGWVRLANQWLFLQGCTLVNRLKRKRRKLLHLRRLRRG
jgi:hypothetical protein